MNKLKNQIFNYTDIFKFNKAVSETFNYFLDLFDIYICLELKKI